jgi:hypothetical protein
MQLGRRTGGLACCAEVSDIGNTPEETVEETDGCVATGDTVDGWVMIAGAKDGRVATTCVEFGDSEGPCGGL